MVPEDDWPRRRNRLDYILLNMIHSLAGAARVSQLALHIKFRIHQVMLSAKTYIFFISIKVRRHKTEIYIDFTNVPIYRTYIF